MPKNFRDHVTLAFSKKIFRGHKTDLDSSVEWFQLLFRKIKLTSVKAIVCPEGTSEIYWPSRDAISTNCKRAFRDEVCISLYIYLADTTD